jgi:hypothetical protein
LIGYQRLVTARNMEDSMMVTPHETAMVQPWTLELNSKKNILWSKEIAFTD